MDKEKIQNSLKTKGIKLRDNTSRMFKCLIIKKNHLSEEIQYTEK